jgi:bla regulator protein BlaR1
MNFNFLSRVWTEFAPGLGNHLWQSTLFVVVVALLTLAFRSNRAGTRYGLWMAASVKFLVPFSVLIKLGGYFSSFRPAHDGAANSVVSLTIMQLNQPFNAQTAAVMAHPAVSGADSLQLLSRFAPFLLIVWVVGILTVLTIWSVRWHRVSAIARHAIALRDGAEAEIVARLQDGDAPDRRVEIVSTTDAIEPGIFGISRPVLLWPAAMRGQVSEAHIESIVEHELCHVRRRDNLTAMVHMLVEALFWFHPFVWWIGGRLVEDRERACDEAVVESGRERRVYAESILKVCEFCVESPLPCVPGVSGADLKRRIAMIMSHRAVRPIGVGRKLLLVAACCLAITVPMVSGALRGKLSRGSGGAAEYADNVVDVNSASFGEVTIKPDPDATAKLKANSGVIVSRVIWKDGELNATGTSLRSLILLTYPSIEDSQITGGADWIKTEVFNVHAKASAGLMAAWPKLTTEQRDEASRAMLQNFLASSFGLKVHRESKVEPTYALVVDNEAKLRSFDGDCPPLAPDARPLASVPPEKADPRTIAPSCGMMTVMPGEVRGDKIQIWNLLRFLTIYSGRTVQDKTNLTKRYDVNLKFTPDKSVLPPSPPLLPGMKLPEVDPNGPSLFDALVQQTGLRLVPQTGPLEMLVVDDATMPGQGSGAGR